MKLHPEPNPEPTMFWWMGGPHLTPEMFAEAAAEMGECAMIVRREGEWHFSTTPMQIGG